MHFWGHCNLRNGPPNESPPPLRRPPSRRPWLKARRSNQALAESRAARRLAESPLPSEPTNPWLKWSLHRPRGFIAAFIAFVVFMAGIAFIAFVVFTSGIAADFDNEIGVQFTGVHSADFGMVLL